MHLSSRYAADRHAGANEEAARAGRLSEQQQTSDNSQQQQRRSAIVEPKQRNKLDDYDREEHRRAGEKAQELFREIARRGCTARE